MTSTPPSGDSQQQRLRHLLGRLAVALLVVVLVIALALAGFSLLMARVPAYRADMQGWLGRQSGLDISFATLRARWRRFGPELVFTDAVLRSADGRRTLIVARRGSAGFDLWTALRTGRLAAGRYFLSGTELKAVRKPDGHFELVGQADWPELDNDEPFDFNDLPVGELSVDNVRLSFRDQQGGRGPWALEHLSFTVLRDSSNLQLRGQASLPASLGKNISFSARGSGNLGDLGRLDWSAELGGTQLDLAGWAQVVPADWALPRQGKGSFQLAASFVGDTPQSVTGRMNLVDVVVAPPASPGGVTFARVAAKLRATRDASGWHAEFSDVQLHRQGFERQSGNASLDVLHASAGADSLRVRADSIVLDTVWPLLAYLPAGVLPASWLARNGSGHLNHLDVRLQRGAADAPLRFGLCVDFADLGLAASGHSPGGSGFTGRLIATGARGELSIDSHHASLALPWLFRAPLPADRLSGTVTWTRDDAGIHLHGNDISVRSPDGNARAQFALELPRRGGPNIDLHAQAADLDARATPRYVPAGITPPDLLAWLDAAFPAGVVHRAQLSLKGPLQNFPFRDGSGLFLIRADIAGLTLNYQRGWLPATDLALTAEFRNAGFSATASDGQLGGLHITQATGHMDSYYDATLELSAQGGGDLASGLRYLQHSPVGPGIGDLFQKLQGRGALTATSHLRLPFDYPDHTQLDVDASLRDCTLGLAGIGQRATGLSGTLHATADAVTAANLDAQFLQGRVHAAAIADTGGHFTIVADGRAQAAPLAQLLHLPAAVRIDGETSYHFTAPAYAAPSGAAPHHLFSVDSDLNGLAVHVPAPLGKPRNRLAATHVEVAMHDANTIEAQGSQGDLRVAALLSSGNDGWRVERGTLRADGIAAALPADGRLQVIGSLDEFTLDDWLQFSQQTDAKGSTGMRASDTPRSVDVTIAHLRLFGLEWPAVHAVVQPGNTAWQVRLDGPQSTGDVTIPYDTGSGRPVVADMENLVLTLPVTTAAESQRRFEPDPRDLPTLQASVNHLHIAQHDVGSLRLRGQHLAQGWQLDAASVSNDMFTAAARGSWLQTTVGLQSQLEVTLESTDLRGTLQRLGYAELVAARHARLYATLSWPGGPEGDVLARSSGNLSLLLENGQLLTVQPGAGRVLGLFSIATLPRRMHLDFRDIIDKGLIFDSVRGDFTITDGDARTQNLLLRGPSADIGIVGRVGLGAEDYDQTAAVSGDFGTALPVAGAVIAVNPVLKGALLLFTQLFKGKLKGMARAYYHIGGSWENPLVERIDAGTARASEAEAGEAPAATRDPGSSN